MKKRSLLTRSIIFLYEKFLLLLIILVGIVWGFIFILTARPDAFESNTLVLSPLFMIPVGISVASFIPFAVLTWKKQKDDDAAVDSMNQYLTDGNREECAKRFNEILEKTLFPEVVSMVTIFIETLSNLEEMNRFIKEAENRS